MTRLLTKTPFLNAQAGLTVLAMLWSATLAASPTDGHPQAVAQPSAEIPLTSAAPQVKASADTIKIQSRSYEPRRERGSLMTWVIQKTAYENGVAVHTLAGVQFENALGLSVLLIDDVVPSAVGSGLGSRTQVLEDDLTPSDVSPEFGPARLKLQMRSMLVSLTDVRTRPEARQEIPMCANGYRRAVVFLRPEQLRRQLNLNETEAASWSRYGRAACVHWDKLPAKTLSKN